VPPRANAAAFSWHRLLNLAANPRRGVYVLRHQFFDRLPKMTRRPSPPAHFGQQPQSGREMFRSNISFNILV